MSSPAAQDPVHENGDYDDDEGSDHDLSVEVRSNGLAGNDCTRLPCIPLSLLTNGTEWMIYDWLARGTKRAAHEDGEEEERDDDVQGIVFLFPRHSFNSSPRVHVIASWIDYTDVGYSFYVCPGVREGLLIQHVQCMHSKQLPPR